jgi:hypothetical protein
LLKRSLVFWLEEDPPLSLAALYAQVNHTAPPMLRALVQGSATRLRPVIAADCGRQPPSGQREASGATARRAALLGHTRMVFDPDSGLVMDIIACEDAHESERTAAATWVAGARPGEWWIADRHFCTQTLLVQVARDYPGMLIALPAPEWHLWSEATPERVAQYLLPLASQVSPRRVATCKRGPKKDQSKPDVDAAVVRKHLSTARVLRDAKVKTP